MKTAASLVLAGAGLALAAPGRFASSILKRTGYEACDNDCKLAGAAFPDKHTLQLMLENNWSEQCPPIYIGDADAPTATSRVCLDFVGPNVHFSFSSFPGYTYKSGAVSWKLMGNLINPGSWSAPPPDNTVTCGPNPSGDGLLCALPFSDILGTSAITSIKDLLSGMCPNGDREGLGLYLEFSGQVESTADSSVTSFKNQSPCTSRDASGQCTARDTATPYIEMAYRCSTCNVAACPPDEPEPPVTTTCGFGTGFGYQSPQKSLTLNTLSGQGCKRWGWYSTPSLAELQGGGISGPLYVGAGNNDISKATNVGTWAATANAAGSVTVSYLLNPPYTLDEVHVNLACTPIAKCAPGQYTLGKGGLNDVPTFASGPIKYPPCAGSSKAALIVHAAVDVLVEGTTCPAKTD
ncbi:hypothetical protein C8A00DRAFT_34925 [Chaetomidium leptoderma]|uniref:Uncharacterized protein n=1 Tax=Chaetomidium leptoderma TaxID=669021 RepID=A0AAN6VJF6_9PEZI|nr:hypothetical protein C8A00DRAFT_34925 [Chaetomidium leptoderma]